MPSNLDSTSATTQETEATFSPDTCPQVCLQPSCHGGSAFAAPPGTNTDFPRLMPRHLGPQFIHRLGSTAQTFCPCTQLVLHSFLDPCSSLLMCPPPVSPPSHPSNPLPQGPSSPRPCIQRPWQPAPSTAPHAAVCFPRFRSVGFSSCAASRKTLMEFHSEGSRYFPPFTTSPGSTSPRSLPQFLPLEK